MKYIIDELVVFRTDDGAIWLSGDEESKILLSPIVSRLLTLLIEGKGNILTREEILHHVWTAHGLEASGNSLNQYISQLRKLMSNFGLGDSVIHTLPRIGFRLDEHLKVDKLPSSTNNQQKLLIASKKNTERLHPIITLLTPVFLFMTIAVPYVISKTIYHWNIRQNVIEPRSIGIVNGCNVYGTGMDKKFYSNSPLVVTQNIFDDLDIQCKESNVALFYMQEGVSHGKSGRTFIALCSKSGASLTSCKSKLFNSWH